MRLNFPENIDGKGKYFSLKLMYRGDVLIHWECKEW